MHMLSLPVLHFLSTGKHILEHSNYCSLLHALNMRFIGTCCGQRLLENPTIEKQDVGGDCHSIVWNKATVVSQAECKQVHLDSWRRFSQGLPAYILIVNRVWSFPSKKKKEKSKRRQTALLACYIPGYSVTDWYLQLDLFYKNIYLRNVDKTQSKRNDERWLDPRFHFYSNMLEMTASEPRCNKSSLYRRQTWLTTSAFCCL